MFIRMLLPIFCFAGMIIGFLILVSPLYINGGIVCWLYSVPPDAWISHLLGTLISFVLGFVVIVGFGLFAVLTGFVFAVEAAANSKARPTAVSSPGGANAPSAGTELSIGSQHSVAVGMNANSDPEDDD